jgi:putative redox protein
MKHQVKVDWAENMAFTAKVQDHTFRMDAGGNYGDGTGPSPKRVLLSALAGCTGMDVVALLKKMRASFSTFTIDVEANLTEDHPKRYADIHLTYTFGGSDLKRNKIEKAVEMSQERYCGIAEMLRGGTKLSYSVEFEEQGVHA